MPRRKQTRRPYRRRYRRRRRKTIVANKDPNITYVKPNQSRIVFKGVGFPRSFMTKLVYNQLLDFSGTTDFQNYVFRANSVYDPDYSGAGNQPMWFDEFAQLYHRYTVYASKIEATFINQASTTGNAPFAHVCVTPKDISTVALDIEDELEYNRAKSSILSRGDGSQGLTTIRHYVNINNILGKSKYEKSDDVVSSVVGSNPSRQVYWHVMGQSMSAGNKFDAYCKVKITYYVKFYQLQQVTGS